MAYRILLTIEELGELAECFTKGKPQSEKTEELADILILTLGHAIAMDVDLEAAFNLKMKEIMTRPAIMGELGIRVTKYQQE
jgi:NTP pyrophosphatase (non-canonical NTP hydrolase)